MPMLQIRNLHARTVASSTDILSGLNLELAPGKVVAIMGPNGSGKSTLAKVICGHPDYEVTSGEILFKKENKNIVNLLELEPYERAQAGIFLGFQYPVEIPGVSNSVFLREAVNEICRGQGAKELDPYDFSELLKKRCRELDMDAVFIHRSVNEGFSGGEKKKNEILQLLLLNPRLALLDETDSGLDIDALKIVARGINSFKSPRTTTLLITHYQRLLDYIIPDEIHVLAEGRIVRSGGKDLARELEAAGYAGELGL